MVGENQLMPLFNGGLKRAYDNYDEFLNYNFFYWLEFLLFDSNFCVSIRGMEWEFNF